MGQGLWRVARNQQLQQEYSEQCFLQRSERRRRMTELLNETPPHSRRVPQCHADIGHLLRTRKAKEEQGFIDLDMLPPELSITILSYLNATDLCLASCVWQDLGNDEYLWQGLCKSTWGHCSIYNRLLPPGFSYRKLYMQLDEGSLTFNANPEEGIAYLMSKSILLDHPKEIAKFIFYTRTLNWKMLRIYLDERFVNQSFCFSFSFFEGFFVYFIYLFIFFIFFLFIRGFRESPSLQILERCSYSNEQMIRHVSDQSELNAVYVLCYSLILLSIDLSSPHVKNKMSKREFIRNTRRAAQNISEDFVGHLYDNIYLIGHVAA
ncbi:F-box only protein 8, partial [Silurus meridionalis]